MSNNFIRDDDNSTLLVNEDLYQLPVKPLQEKEEISYDKTNKVSTHLSDLYSDKITLSMLFKAYLENNQPSRYDLAAKDYLRKTIKKDFFEQSTSGEVEYLKIKQYDKNDLESFSEEEAEEYSYAKKVLCIVLYFLKLEDKSTELFFQQEEDEQYDVFFCLQDTIDSHGIGFFTTKTNYTFFY